MTDGDRQLPLDIVPIEEAVPALEALLFASGEPEDVPTLAAALEWSQGDVRRALAALEDDLRARPRGIALQRDGDRVQLVTVARYGRAVERLLGIERQVKLSSAALILSLSGTFLISVIFQSSGNCASSITRRPLVGVSFARTAFPLISCVPSDCMANKMLLFMWSIRFQHWSAIFFRCFACSSQNSASDSSRFIKK